MVLLFSPCQIKGYWQHRTQKFAVRSASMLAGFFRGWHLHAFSLSRDAFRNGSEKDKQTMNTCEVSQQPIIWEAFAFQ